MLYVPIMETQIKNCLERWDKNNRRLSEINEDARKKGELLHRVIYIPYADGHAVYQIIKVNKRTVRIKACIEIGDDWIIPYWGKEASVDKQFVEQEIRKVDLWSSLINH